jgi:hypothetical protein
MAPRRPNTPWQPTRSTQRPSSIEPIAERGSMALTTIRWLTIDIEPRCDMGGFGEGLGRQSSALPIMVVEHDVARGTSSWSCGAPSASGRLGAGHGRQRLDVEHATGFCRVASPGPPLRATTTATTSPTKRTLSLASDQRGGVFNIGVPSPLRDVERARTSADRNRPRRDRRRSGSPARPAFPRGPRTCRCPSAGRARCGCVPSTAWAWPGRLMSSV